MSTNRKHAGFTLVEVLIVVVIMAILAATIIPQFSDSAKDAKISSVKFNLHTLRTQIETYKSQHEGRIPTSGLAELTIATNQQGTTTAPTPYGPYLSAIPVNPFTNSNTVVDVSTDPPTATVSGAGWLYNPTTGKLYINDTTIPFAQQ